MVLIPVTFAASVYFKVFFTESSVMQSKEKLDYLSEGWVIFSQNWLIDLYRNPQMYQHFLLGGIILVPFNFSNKVLTLQSSLKGGRVTYLYIHKCYCLFQDKSVRIFLYSLSLKTSLNGFINPRLCRVLHSSWLQRSY